MSVSCSMYIEKAFCNELSHSTKSAMLKGKRIIILALGR